MPTRKITPAIRRQLDHLYFVLGQHSKFTAYFGGDPFLAKQLDCSPRWIQTLLHLGEHDDKQIVRKPDPYVHSYDYRARRIFLVSPYPEGSDYGARMFATVARSYAPDQHWTERHLYNFCGRLQCTEAQAISWRTRAVELGFIEFPYHPPSKPKVEAVRVIGEFADADVPLRLPPPPPKPSVDPAARLLQVVPELPGLSLHDYSDAALAQTLGVTEPKARAVIRDAVHAGSVYLSGSRHDRLLWRRPLPGLLMPTATVRDILRFVIARLPVSLSIAHLSGLLDRDPDTVKNVCNSLLKEARVFATPVGRGRVLSAAPLTKEAARLAYLPLVDWIAKYLATRQRELEAEPSCVVSHFEVRVACADKLVQLYGLDPMPLPAFDEADLRIVPEYIHSPNAWVLLNRVSDRIAGEFVGQRGNSVPFNADESPPNLHDVWRLA